METFGVWTPFALKTLRNIADRTTPCSGIPRKVVRKNLIGRSRYHLFRLPVNFMDSSSTIELLGVTDTYSFLDAPFFTAKMFLGGYHKFLSVI